MADDENVGVDMEDMEDVEAEVEALEEIVPVEGNAATEAAAAATAHSMDTLQTLFKHHPECRIYSIEALAPRTLLLASPPDHVIGQQPVPDEHHQSKPWLTQYERTKILGFRTNQIAQGAKPYILVPKHVVEASDIAKLELKERRLPFMIARIMPDGSYEFWRLSDLMVL